MAESKDKQLKELVLLPAPQRMRGVDGRFEFGEGGLICLMGESPTELFRTGHLVKDALSSVGPRWELTASGGRWDRQNQAVVSLSPGGTPRAQGYILVIDQRGVELVGADEAGLFYGAMTLKQICRQFAGKGFLPCLRIEDWPDFPHRGVMLDISRDKVPTMKTLVGLVDFLAECKVNQFQLYTEHTFAYRNHKAVWKTASPMTGEQMILLDAYCRERHIDLVPNQNSFGHLSRWLQLPEYQHLAEDPEAPFSICPLDPKSMSLLEELYGELLPHFSSAQFNVGCDETGDLGKGRSKEVCEEKGAGRVYLDFLMEIYSRVTASEKTMQFWGDIVLKHPELIQELPTDLIALVWGYEGDHPFEEHCQLFSDAGVPFFVCPGTSSWNSIAGRTDNAIENIRSAAESGKAHGAHGVLLTDWGDNGHWQHLPVSYLGYAYGSAMSWCVSSNVDLDLPRALDLHVFHDGAEIMGTLAYEMGNAYKVCEGSRPNRSILCELLLHPEASLDGAGPLAGMSVEGLEKARNAVDEVMLFLSEARMARGDAVQIMDEYRNAASLLRHACHLGTARLKCGGGALAEIPENTRRVLAVELDELISDYRRLWLARNRPGGLSDSLGRLRDVLRRYGVHTDELKKRWVDEFPLGGFEANPGGEEA